MCKCVWTVFLHSCQRRGVSTLVWRWLIIHLSVNEISMVCTTSRAKCSPFKGDLTFRRVSEVLQVLSSCARSSRVNNIKFNEVWNPVQRPLSDFFDCDWFSSPEGGRHLLVLMRKLNFGLCLNFFFLSFFSSHFSSEDSFPGIRKSESRVLSHASCLD